MQAADTGFSLALDKGYLSTWTDRCIEWMRGWTRVDKAGFDFKLRCP